MYAPCDTEARSKRIENRVSAFLTCVRPICSRPSGGHAKNSNRPLRYRFTALLPWASLIPCASVSGAREPPLQDWHTCIQRVTGNSF